MKNNSRGGVYHLLDHVILSIFEEKHSVGTPPLVGLGFLY